MAEIWSCEGKRALVSGGGGAGTGAKLSIACGFGPGRVTGRLDVTAFG